MTHIVILGAGFAALKAIQVLRKQGFNEQITLVAPKAELFYYPSLIWVPAGLRDEKDLTVDIRHFLSKNKVTHHVASVTTVEPQDNKVVTSDGDVSYDRLIIATGGRFIKKLNGIEHSYTPCEGYAPTKAYSDKLAQMDGGTLAFGFGGNPKEPAAMRGGPMFEFLFGIDTLLRKQGKRDKFELVFFSPAPKPGKRLGEKAVDRLLAEMQRRGIKTHLGNKMQGFTANSVKMEGDEFHSDLTMFMPGMTGATWFANSSLPLSAGGFIQADEFCQVAGYSGIYVAGDSGSFAGPDWMPKQAHIADLQAEAAAKNLLDGLEGKAASHTFTPELICIVDTLDSGVLVFRNPKRSFMMKGFWLHWAKRFFEWFYLRTYR